MAYVIINKFNMGRAKVLTRPFVYMSDAVDCLTRMQIDYQSNGIPTKTLDDDTFICFTNGIPSYFRVVKAREAENEAL